MMPADALDRLRPFDAIFFGAVGDPRLQDNVTLNGLLLPIRRGFDQYACVRPAVLYPGVRVPAGRQDSRATSTSSSFARTPKGSTRRSAACSIRRAARSGRCSRRCSRGTAPSASSGSRSISRAAGMRKRLLTSVTKSNAQGFSMAFWDRVFAEVARDYPDIRTESLLVDAACMDLVRRPRDFDVIVASNLFGDILTDLSAAITGSLGLAPSANLNPPRTFPSMFEPVHGSAPDIAGRGIANPMATMLAGAMMLDFLEQPTAAQAIESAVRHVLARQSALTPDLGGTGTTETVTGAVLDQLDKDQKVYAGKEAK